ncbi:forkhead box protein J2 [Corynespora cassiicola Philippines]|uniref:Forkhead box protein J2 n=1 Tax=Corynespora cassiicola Philippines TaxID=1448308 RepID=A0A2T2N440_CORCC|nr:forkhead box protein J2 [Corynespora cassiicola Philippines]
MAVNTTRRNTPFHVFTESPESHHPQLDAQLLDAFPSVTDVSSDHHTRLAPPHIHAHEPSPRKTRHVSSSPPPSALAEKGINKVSLPPPKEPQFQTDAPAKKMQRHFPKHPQPMAAHQPYFANYPAQFDKENVYAIPDATLGSLPANPPVKPAASASASASGKRGLMDSAPLRDRSKKQKVREPRVEEQDGPLPAPDEMPPVEDDGNKPPFSYAVLIGMAILRAPNRRLTLAQIYKWISDTFAFYRNTQDTGWQNSIRHNLSLSKSFSKQERPKDDPGKGHYWRINAGFEKQYYKIKSTRRPTNPDGFVPAYPSELPRPPTSTSASLPPLSSSKGFDSSKFPEETELSSDATIPCSDPAAHDGHDPVTMPPPRIPSSPPPADIRSSPPPAVSRSMREDTPPRAPRFPPSSRSGGRKRKFNGLGDSGYYSSIESSATKGQLGPLLTSEADHDRPSIKRGRAEEEIARIRGSSYDSPSKTRPYMKQPNAAQLISSPFRTSDKKDRNDPLTPAVVFKRPALPPASASPNTNLRNHRNKMRELVGPSPDKNMAMWVDTSFLSHQNWSPAVQIPNDENVNLVGDNFESTFDIFGEYDYQESPLRPSAKRPRLERAATTSGILADVTGMKPNLTASPTPNWKLSSSFLNIPSMSPAKDQSPIKPPILKPPTSAPLPEFSLPDLDKENRRSGLTPPQTFDGPAQQQDDDDIFRLLNSDDSEPGIDMLQGFEKIGARASAVAPNGSPSKVSRPGLARSSTTRF